MQADLAIFSQRTWLDNQLQPATVFISGGRIVHIEKGKSSSLECPYDDVGNNVLMPGLIDVHVHINEPGRTEWEGFDTATKAAAAGGITTIVDMPLNSSPVSTSPEAFQTKLAAAQGKTHVNCAFWGGIVPENAVHLEPLLDSGVLGIKAFLIHSGIDEFPNVSQSDLEIGMATIAPYGLPILAHCELDLAHPEKEQSDLNPASYAAYLQSRPKDWENEAVALMIKLCRRYNCPTHIVHLSSAEALPEIRNAKAEGLPLTVETCPHYLYFSAENIPDSDTLYKCAPPIREKANQDLLWAALEEGLIDFIATDHSPCTPELKRRKEGDLVKAWGGIAGLQFLLPVVWTAAKKRNISLDKIVTWLSQKPADFINCKDRKGKIAIGYDADLCIWNPEEEWTLQEEDIHFRHKISPYIGQNFFGKVLQTYVCGKKVFDGGKFLNLNCGAFLLRKQD